MLMGAGAGSALAATLAYSTYFGASDYDGAYAVAVDDAGNAFVAGGTSAEYCPLGQERADHVAHELHVLS